MDSGSPDDIFHLEFFIPGEPQAWQRAGDRVVAPPGGKAFVQHFTPKRTRSYESLVRELGDAAMRGASPWLDAELGMEVEIRFAIPASASKKKQAAMRAGDIRPTRRPDTTNIVKGIEDALNKIAYRDDSMIVGHILRKIYSDKVGVRVIVGPRQLWPGL